MSTWDEKSNFRARCERTAREDRNRFRFVAVCLLLWACAIMFGCADKGPLQAPSLGAAVKYNSSIQTANASIKKNVSKANSDINEVLRDNAIIARPDLTLKLQDANGQLVDADATIGQQAAIITQQGGELASKQKDIDTVTAQGNAWKAALDATGPKHKRDIWAIAIAYGLGSLFSAYGPLLFKAYPALIFFPDWLEGTVCSIAGFLVGSSIVGLMVLFGVL